MSRLGRRALVDCRIVARLPGDPTYYPVITNVETGRNLFEGLLIQAGFTLGINGKVKVVP
jgi:hypothetical protein